MIRLEIIDHTQDHFLVTTNEPARFEISLIGYPPRVILHGYKGDEIDTEQEPDIVYDGMEHSEMEGRTA